MTPAIYILQCEEISTLSICNEINNSFPNKAVGVMLHLYEKWDKQQIWLKVANLIEGGFKLEGITVIVYVSNPYVNTSSSKKLTEK